eukprot:143790-Prorocentrum_lima.AAC.1
MADSNDAVSSLFHQLLMWGLKELEEGFDITLQLAVPVFIGGLGPLRQEGAEEFSIGVEGSSGQLDFSMAEAAGMQ